MLRTPVLLLAVLITVLVAGALLLWSGPERRPAPTPAPDPGDSRDDTPPVGVEAPRATGASDDPDPGSRTASARGGTVVVQALDAGTGQPLERFSVRALARRWSAEAFEQQEVARAEGTGADGARLEELRAGEELVLVVSSRRHRTHSRPIVALVAGELRRVEDVALEPAVRVHGRVVDPSGGPLEGVELDAGSKTAVSDEQGRFELWIEPRSRRLHAHHAGWTLAPPFHVPLEGSGVPEELLLTMHPASTIAGRVVGPAPRGVADVGLDARCRYPDGSEGYRTTRSREDGGFVLDDIPSEATVRLFVQRPLASGEDGIEVVPGDRHVQVELVAYTPLRLEVVDAEGRPCRPDRVELRTWSPRKVLDAANLPEGSPQYGAEWEGEELEAARGSDGAYRLELVPLAVEVDPPQRELLTARPWPYRLRVLSPGHLACEQTLQLVDREQQTIRVELSAASVLHGFVFGSDGRPLAGAELQLLCCVDPSWAWWRNSEVGPLRDDHRPSGIEGPTRSDGSYRLPLGSDGRLPEAPSMVRVRVWASSGEVWQSEPVEVDPRGADVRCDIHFPEGGWLEGEVLADAPLPETQFVLAHAMDGRSAWTPRDADGFYRLGPLAPGRYQVRLSSSRTDRGRGGAGGAVASPPEVVPASDPDDHPVVITAGQISHHDLIHVVPVDLTGRVLLGGRPAEGLELRLTRVPPPGLLPSRRPLATDRSDALGRYLLAQVREGEYELKLRRGTELLAERRIVHDGAPMPAQDFDLPSRRVGVRLVDAETGQAVRARVQVNRTDTRAPVQRRDSGADGRAEFEDLMPGLYRLSLSSKVDPDEERMKARELDLRVASELEIEWELPVRSALSANWDRDRFPEDALPRAWLEHSDGQRREVPTRVNGLQLHGLPPGSAVLVLERPGVEAPLRIPLQLVPMRTTVLTRELAELLDSER